MVQARVVLPRFGVARDVHFLVDTGSDTTILHSDDGNRLNCPFDQLENPATITSVSGTQTYYTEPAVVSLYDGEERQDFRTDIFIAKPHPSADELESLLGRDILNRLAMEYDFTQKRLRFALR